MAKEKMMKMRVQKIEVTECVFCDLHSRIREAVNAQLQQIKDRGEENIMDTYDAMETKVIGVSGFKFSVTRPVTKTDDYWNVDNGYIRCGTVVICKKCADSLVKCLTRIDDAEEICFAKADSFKNILLPTDEDLIIKEEEEEN